MTRSRPFSPLLPMPPNSRIFDPKSPIALQSSTPKPVDSDSIMLTRIDVHEIMQRWFPHLHEVTEYFAHHVENHLWMHVAFQEQQEQVTIAVTTCLSGTTDYICQRVFEEVAKVQGMKGGTVYMWSKENHLIRARLILYAGHWRITYFRTILSALPYPSFCLESGPNRVVHNDTLLRLADLDGHDGFLVTGFQKQLPFLQKNSVVHRGRIIAFVSDDARMCRKINDRLICVTSPLFPSVGDSFPILHLALAKDHYCYVYLFIPACKTLVIVDPENLRFCEKKVLFENDWNVEETANAMMNLVSIAERAVTIGIPTLAIDSSTGSRQIVGYSIWTGVIPWKLKWHYSDQYPYGITDNECEFSTPGESISRQTTIDANQAEVPPDEMNQSMPSELELLREENERLKNSLNAQKEIVDKLRTRNYELSNCNRKLASEYEAKIERLKNEVMKVRNAREVEQIKERSRDEAIFDGEWFSDKSEEPPYWDDVDVETFNIDDCLSAMVESTAIEHSRIGDLAEVEANSIPDRRTTPKRSEKKRRVNVAMRTRAATPVQRSALPSPHSLDSSSPPSIARTPMPIEKLFPGENFTPWGADGAERWEDFGRGNTQKIDK